MKKNILVAAVFSLFITMLSSCNDGTSSKETTSDSSTNIDNMNHDMNASGNSEHDQMMTKMDTDMKAVKLTGDFDLDFASMMIPHHQSAVDMSEMYLPKAKDEKIKAMAQNIINSQKKEIEDLKTMITNHKPSVKKETADAGHGAGGHNELMDAMNMMMAKMKAMQMSGDVDKDFVSMMIPHHQSAVDMAENEISHGKHVEMKKFAQSVIEGQSKEIKEFQNWLSSKK
jgi:uncharacterized protein (DUF305 family)